ncbi:DUF3618 domain-containing protein [Longispora urticae]
MTQQKSHSQANATRPAVEADIAATRAELADTVGALADKLDLPARARQAADNATMTARKYLDKASPVARKAATDPRVMVATASAAGLVAGWLLAIRRERSRRWDREIARRLRQR